MLNKKPQTEYQQFELLFADKFLPISEKNKFVFRYLWKLGLSLLIHNKSFYLDTYVGKEVEKDRLKNKNRQGFFIALPCQRFFFYNH